MKRFHLQAILLSFLLMSCGGVSAGAQPEEPGFIVITKHPDDQVEIKYENGTSLIDIQSPAGISSATFELESGSMPEKMILRLQLKGLEQLRLTSALLRPALLERRRLVDDGNYIWHTVHSRDDVHAGRRDQHLGPGMDRH
jgi:hypothetical protein